MIGEGEHREMSQASMDVDRCVQPVDLDGVFSILGPNRSDCRPWATTRPDHCVGRYLRHCRFDEYVNVSYTASL